SERKEIDPSNRGSIVIGSVAFYLDRYGYDVLPLAVRMLRGEPIPPRTVTRHKLITAANVSVDYPPYDMNSGAGPPSARAPDAAGRRPRRPRRRRSAPWRRSRRP